MGERYKLKNGKCSLLLGGKRIELKPGDEVELGKLDIMPDGFKNQFERILSKGEVVADDENPDAELPDNFIISHKGAGKYDVINKATGKKINDVLLKKADAESLVNFQTAADGKGVIDTDEMERTENLAE